MSDYIQGYNSAKGNTVNPFAVVLDEVNKGYERRRAEDKLRESEDRKLKDLFAKMKLEADYATELQRQKGEQDIEKEFFKGEIEGNLRPRALPNTPIGAIGNAMQPQIQPQGEVDEGVPSLDAPGYQFNQDDGTRYSNTSGRIQPPTSRGVPRETSMAQGITQQAGLAPRVIKSPSGKEYEQVDKSNEIPEGMEIVGYDQKGRPMIRKVSTAEKKFESEQKELQDLKQRQSEEFTSIAQDTLDTISKVEEGKEYFGWKSYLPALPESKKVGWDANVNKLLSGKILETIADMKRTSKTGATGFGQLNRAELKVLTDASTALKKTMSQEDAQPYLDKMKNAMNKIIERETGGQGQGQSSQYVRTGTLPDGRKIGVKQDGTTEIISGQ